MKNDDGMDQWRQKLEAIRDGSARPESGKPATNRPMTEAEMTLLDTILNNVTHRLPNQNLDTDATNKALLAVLEERQTPELFERGVAFASADLQAREAWQQFCREVRELGITNIAIDDSRNGKTPFRLFTDRVWKEAQKRTGISQ